jgi:hypothetical protein
MKKTVHQYNFIDTLGEAYEDFLESAEKKTHQIGTSFHGLISAILGREIASAHAANLEESMTGELIKASSYNFIDTLGEAYEALLVSTQQKIHRIGSGIRRVIDLFRGGNMPGND